MKPEIKEDKNDLQINNLPNRLTLFRITLIPIVVACLVLEGKRWPALESWHGDLSWIAAWIFALASVTDFIDGYIARKRGIVTVFGSFLDPIADKFLVVSSLVMLLSLGRVSALVVITLILREFYITSLRLFAIREEINIPVNSMGKWKTAMQLTGISMLMANDSLWGLPLPLIGAVSIYAATALSLYSALIYSIRLVKKLKLKRKKIREQKMQQKLTRKQWKMQKSES